MDKKQKKKKNRIDIGEVWSLKEIDSNTKKVIFGIDDANWILHKQYYTGKDYFKVFVNVNETKFNWLIRLWSWLNFK